MRLATILLVLLLLLLSSSTSAQELPKTILIGTQIWNVYVVDTIPESYGGKCQGKHHVPGTPWRGMTISGGPEKLHDILVVRQTPRAQAVTVVHEIMHAATNVEFSCTEMTGHDAIYDLSEAVVTVLVQNPALWQYLKVALYPEEPHGN